MLTCLRPFVCAIAVYALNFAALRYMRSRKNICAGMSIVRCRVRARWRSSYLMSGSLAALILVSAYKLSTLPVCCQLKRCGAHRVGSKRRSAAGMLSELAAHCSTIARTRCLLSHMAGAR